MEWEGRAVELGGEGSDGHSRASRALPELRKNPMSHGKSETEVRGVRVLIKKEEPYKRWFGCCLQTIPLLPESLLIGWVVRASALHSPGHQPLPVELAALCLCGITMAQDRQSVASGQMQSP